MTHPAETLQRVVARTWSDAEFKRRLLAGPAAVLAEEGLTLPEGKRLRLLEDMPQCVHLVLPRRPEDLSDDALDALPGGRIGPGSSGDGRTVHMEPQAQATQAQRAAQAMTRVVARSWADAEFKRKLMADPAAILAAEGIALPPGSAVRVVEDSEDTIHLALPSRPMELSDEELDQVKGGEALLIFGGLVFTGALAGTAVVLAGTSLFTFLAIRDLRGEI